MKRKISNPKYVVCSVCNNHSTAKSSGICSRCERLSPIRWKACVICNERNTKDTSGVCSACRRSRSWRAQPEYSDSESTVLDSAILIAERSLRLLTLRKSGASFQQIGNELGVSKSTAYAIYTRLIGSPMLSISDIDDEFLDVSDYRKESSLNPPRIRCKSKSSIL